MTPTGFLQDPFALALNFTLHWEGWRTPFDPDDPGGKTIWGIAARWHPEEVTAMDGMSQAASRVYAGQIYRRDYWDPVGCDALPWPLAACAFDAAVNVGIGPVRRWLKITRDPHVFNELRRERYRWLVAKTPSSRKYLNGWINRVNDLERTFPAGQAEAPVEIKGG